MMNEQLNLSIDREQEMRRHWEAKFNELIEICFDEGWCPTKCPAGCVVEPDGICPHNFKSIALKLGLI